MTFNPTHRIEYREAGQLVHAWDVAVQECKTALYEDGSSEWSLIDGKPRYNGPLTFKKWPESEVEWKVINLHKRPKCKAGHEVKHMPEGTVMEMTLRDGRWFGKCVASGITVEANATSVMGITSKLCKMWFRERYV